MNIVLSKNKAITLISLIITIIVLLILASVSIAILFGENGIINKAAKAKEESIIAEEKEQIALAFNAVKLKNLGEEVSAEELEYELNGKAKVRKQNDKLVIEFNETGNIYYIDSNGNINKLEENLDIAQAEITFEYNPNKWTNEQIEVTAKINNKEMANNNDYKIQTTKEDPTIEKNWQDTEKQVFTENGKIYARIVDGFGVATKSYATGNVEKIDKINPTITELTPTIDTIKIKAKDEESGIIGYAVTEENTTPTEFINCENTHLLETTIDGREQNKSYFIWIKDEAGNINESISVKTKTQLVTEIILDKKNITINPGDTDTITATVVPNNSYNKNIKWTSDNNSIAIVENGKVTAKEPGIVTITATSLDENGASANCTVEVSKVGQYIAYDCYTGVASTNLTYKSPTAKNGIKDQTFTVTSNPKWRILDTSGDNILITTADPIKTTSNEGFYLNGQEGYNNGINELNTISKLYSHGNYAVDGRSITLDDINKLANFKSNKDYYTVHTVKKENDGYIYINGIKTTYSTFNYYDESKKQWLSLNAGQSANVKIITYYAYNLNETGSQAFLRYIDGTTSNSEYWVASQCGMLDNEYQLRYAMRAVAEGKVYGNVIYYASKGPYHMPHSVRPVVALESGVKLTQKNSKGEWIISK